MKLFSEQTDLEVIEFAKNLVATVKGCKLKLAATIEILKFGRDVWDQAERSGYLRGYITGYQDRGKDDDKNSD